MRRSKSTTEAAVRAAGPSALGDEPLDRLYEAALACFRRNGIARTSMHDVAREAGVSRQAVYYHVATKEDLVLEVVARQASKILRQLNRQLSNCRGADRLIEAAVASIRNALDDPYVRMLVAPDTERLTARLIDSEQIIEIQRAFWYPLLEDARQAGELRTDVDFDEILHWILFLELTLCAEGESFGFVGEEVIRRKLRAFLLPALRG